MYLINADQIEQIGVSKINLIAKLRMCILA